MKVQAGQKVVFIGDSITDAGRAQPVGEGLFDPLGRGFVNFIEALMGSTYPQLGVRIVNVGTSGNTVRDLKARWQRDVFDLNPDWVSVMIGTNDVWRQFDLPRQKQQHVLPEEYEATLDELARQTRPRVKGLVLATPFYVEPNRQDAMRARMDEYSSIVRRLAQKHEAVFVDTQAGFDAAMSYYYPATLAWDRVHPNQTGHMIIARAWLRTMGYQW